MGKSKVAIDLAKEIDPMRILLLTNSETLRDNNWKAEFEKFDATEYWEAAISECYQTVHRWQGEEFDLVIADEIDFAMTEMYQKFFQNNTIHNLLGLTGFCTEEKREILNQYAPVCFEYTTQQGQEESLLNRSEVIFVEYLLSTDKTIMVPKKDKKSFFYTSENEQYKYYDKEFHKAMAIKSKLEREYRLFPDEELLKRVTAAGWKYKTMSAKRKSILNNLTSSVKVVQSLIQQIKREPSNKVLVFSALTSQADKFGIPTFHGKINSSETGLDRLNSGEIKELAVCKAVTRGVNMVGVNYAIKESFDGSEENFQQTHGRLMRLQPGQIAKYLILIPQFSEAARNTSGGWVISHYPTQQLKWATKMMDSFETQIRTIKMTSSYTLPGGVTL